MTPLQKKTSGQKIVSGVILGQLIQPSEDLTGAIHNGTQAATWSVYFNSTVSITSTVVLGEVNWFSFCCMILKSIAELSYLLKAKFYLQLLGHA